MAKFKLTDSQKKEIEIAEQTTKQIQLLKRIQSIKMRDKGLTGLLKWNYSGKVSILTQENLLQLEKRNLEQSFQTTSEAKAYIKEKFGIDFHLHWVQKS